MERIKELISKIKTSLQKFISKVGKDKVLHFICAFIITFIIGLFNLISGIVASIIVSIAKEIFDEFRKKKYQDGIGFSNSDLLADVIGIIIAVIILVIL